MGKGRHTPAPKKEERVGGDEEASSDSEGLPPPPDGGWGWMVVFSSFIIHVIADGIVYSFGIFYVEFLHYFKGGKGETSWVGSLVPAVTYTVGPLSSALTNRYGCRVVTIAGAIVACAGFLLSLLAPNLYYLYFTFGFMAGLGFGLIYLPAIVSVAQYFEKRRSFATGLAVCGSGFGTFILAPFSKFLLHHYSWQGTILIQAGLILNVVVCGALFRPLEAPAPKSCPASREESHEAVEEEAGEEEGEERLALLEPPPDEKVKEVPLIRVDGEAVPANDVEMEGGKKSSKPVGPPLGPPGTPPQNSTFVSTPFLNGNSNSPNIAALARSDGALHVVRKRNQKNEHGHHHHPNHHHGRGFYRQQSHPSGGSTVHLAPLARKDIFYSGSVANIPEFRSHPQLYVQSITSIPSALGGEDQDKPWRVCNCLNPGPEIRDAFSQMLQFSLLKDPIFLMFAISNFFTSIGFNMPFIYLPDRAIERGVNEDQAALLLSVVGIANTAGRVLFGWLSDRKGVNRLMLYNSALTITGVATGLSPFCGGNFPALVVYAAVFGIFIGVYVSLTSVVLVDLLGLDLLTNSFGLLLLFQGAATFIGPPLAGWMSDWTGSYDISFHVFGVIIAISGIMLYFIPCVQRCTKNRRQPGDIVEIPLGEDPVSLEEEPVVSRLPADSPEPDVQSV